MELLEGHLRIFIIWMAGGRVKQRVSYETTDEFGYNLIGKPSKRTRFSGSITTLVRYRL